MGRARSSFRVSYGGLKQPSGQGNVSVGQGPTGPLGEGMVPKASFR